jgi:hypothetical protein
MAPLGAVSAMTAGRQGSESRLAVNRCQMIAQRPCRAVPSRAEPSSPSASSNHHRPAPRPVPHPPVSRRPREGGGRPPAPAHFGAPHFCHGAPWARMRMRSTRFCELLDSDDQFRGARKSRRGLLYPSADEPSRTPWQCSFFPKPGPAGQSSVCACVRGVYMISRAFAYLKSDVPSTFHDPHNHSHTPSPQHLSHPHIPHPACA